MEQTRDRSGRFVNTQKQFKQQIKQAIIEFGAMLFFISFVLLYH